MLKKLAMKLFGGGSPAGRADGFFLDVRCSACGEEFHLFINRTTDLVQNFGEKGNVTYSLNKEIVGTRCRNRIQVKMEFDERRKTISRGIEKGEFISEGAGCI